MKMNKTLRHIAAATAFVLITNIAALNVAAATDDPVELYNEWDESCKEYVGLRCDELGLSEDLVLAIIYNESRFVNGLTHVNVNGTTDWGLMQVNDVCFALLNEDLGIQSMDELLDPYVAIRCGTHILAYHKEFTEDDSLALLRYQVGAGTYKKMISRGETTNDTHSFVMNIAEQFKESGVNIELIDIPEFE